MARPEKSRYHQDFLCSQCRGLDLRASTFYLPPIEAAEQNPDDVTDRIKLGSRSWESIKVESRCNLCQIIASAVESVSRPWQVNDIPQSCELTTSRLNIHGYGTGTGLNKYDLRTLDVVAKYRWSETDTIHLVPIQSSTSPESFVGRRIEQNLIDPKKVLSWLDKCSSEHGERCSKLQTSGFLELQQNLLVVDVQYFCITKLPFGQRYLALSYVWGGADQVRTSSENFKQFQRNGGLTSVAGNLSKTLTDAIDLVKLLGERYLWVDTLCIVQNDIDSKQNMIDKMHIVYRHAFLTIIAATGIDANAGLPGVSTARAEKQQVASVSAGLAFIFPQHYLAIKDSTWASRAWTYVNSKCLLQ